jgi:hypothetical protein
MLGLEKRLDAIREMQGETGTEATGPAKSAANTGIMLALAAMVVAVTVYFGVDGKYAGKMVANDARIAVLEAKLAEAVNAPRDMARKVIVVNTLGEMSQKVESLKGNLDASYHERLGKIDEMLKALKQDLSK